MDDLTVREILTREYVGVSESDTVADAVALMREEASRCVVVLRGSEPVGALTPLDALALVSADGDPDETTVGTVMSGTVPTVDPGAPVVEAARVMADADVGSVLVEDAGEVLGVVSERDVVRATASLAGRTTLGEPADPADGEPVAAANEAGGTATTGGAAGTDQYSSQSVCETCGSLTPDLRNFNGQLICDDCRDV